jgi:hypothetical protein
MKIFIAIILIALGSYFIFEAGTTIFNFNQTAESFENMGNGEYQEIVTYNDIQGQDLKQTYILLTVGPILLIAGTVLLYFSRRKN